MGVFITNTEEKNFKNRLQTLIRNSSELKFLVGFFYFSGIQEFYETLKELYENGKLNDEHIKVLVGLNIDEVAYEICEIAKTEKLFNISIEKVKQDLFDSFRKAFNSSQLDNKVVYEQVDFFIKLLEEGKLIIKKTKVPNHAKLYLFKMNDHVKDILPNLFITGSSNLTKAGVIGQHEFNVEIKDYGFQEAEEYFDKLWENAVALSSEDVNKLIRLLRRETPLIKITPFIAYAYLLKTYVELHQGKNLSKKLIELLEKKGYKPYSYQLEAVSQAIANCEAHNGTILADVVGLGKTVIACLVAKALGKRGMVICPPHLIGDDKKETGWKKYLEDFELYDWEVWSVGKLKEALKFVKEREGIEIIIVDEAHRFRNERTQGYYYLNEICRGKTVILLSATPFNNRPADLFALLKLFTIPKKSSIVLDEDIQSRFVLYEILFKKLAYIKTYHNSSDFKKRNRAIKYYKEIFGEKTVDLEKVRNKTRDLAKEIRFILEPVVIRRNRLDLKHYKEKIDLPEVKDPIEWFFELTKEQLDFYDEVIQSFIPFDEGGLFSGAIYFPIKYEKDLRTDLDIEEFKIGEESFIYVYQRNLYDFMRRLLVKRFESSFGAFYESLNRFKNIHKTALRFVQKTNKFILDRRLMEDLVTADPDTILERLYQYEKDLEEGEINKRYHKVYDLEKFKYRKKFIQDIENDIKLFDTLLKKMENLGLKDNDPKAEKLISGLKEFLSDKRKVVVFTEYLDTAKHLKAILEKVFKEQLLCAFGSLSKKIIDELNKNFDAQHKVQEDQYKILLTTDKLSEGINLNRAGAVINYDIPWNPVRVIQRVGRINRIGKKVYEEIYIVNFFPTEKGADIVKSREIAQTKMFMIHNVLGEDAKIFAPDEEPQPSELYRRLTIYIEDEEESFYTKIKREYEDLIEKYPEILKEIKDLPRRIKVAKRGEKDELMIFIKKGKDLFVSYKDYSQKHPIATTFEKVYEKIKCLPDENSLTLSDNFWEHYHQMINDERSYIKRTPPKPNELSNRAYNLLTYIIKIEDDKIKSLKPFISNLLEDIRDYGTLSDFVLSEIVSLEKNLKDLDRIAKKLNELKEEIGENFLEKIDKRVRSLTKEIIIAIENQLP
uniref:Helicase n=1 Tax=Thermodesulfobacterium geofontis TaxID=1295609 RepID=A0A7C4NSN1_9BACT